MNFQGFNEVIEQLLLFYCSVPRFPVPGRQPEVVFRRDPILSQQQWLPALLRLRERPAATAKLRQGERVQRNYQFLRRRGKRHGVVREFSMSTVLKKHGPQTLLRFRCLVRLELLSATKKVRKYSCQLVVQYKSYAFSMSSHHFLEFCDTFGKIFLEVNFVDIDNRVLFLVDFLGEVIDWVNWRI